MENKSLKISLFYCSNSLDTNAVRYCCSEMGNDEIRAVSVPCSGKVNLPYLVKAFETGSDGVLLLTCKEGFCQYLEGNLRARKRAKGVNELLEEIGYPSGRMAILQLKDDDSIENLNNEIKRFCSKIRN